MFKIRIEVKEIDYEKSFEHIIPKLTEGLRSKADPNEIEKFVDRLGDDIVPLMKKLLGFLDTDTRDQIIVWILESQQETLISTVNKSIHDMLGVDAVKIGSIYAQDRPGTKISLSIAQVQMDSKQLVESPALTGISGGLAKLIFSLAKAETIEKEGISLLSSDYVKPQLISSLTDGLREAGLYVNFHDLVIVEDSGKDEIPHMMDPEKDEGLLPDAIEDKIIDALVAWLKEIL